MWKIEICRKQDQGKWKALIICCQHVSFSTCLWKACIIKVLILLWKIWFINNFKNIRLLQSVRIGCKWTCLSVQCHQMAPMPVLLKGSIGTCYLHQTRLGIIVSVGKPDALFCSMVKEVSWFCSWCNHLLIICNRLLLEVKNNIEHI